MASTLMIRSIALGVIAAVVLTGRAGGSQISTGDGSGLVGRIAFACAGVAAGGAGVSSCDVVDNVVDEQDRDVADQAAQRALGSAPTGTKVAWTNPDNGHEGSITPMHTCQTLGG